MKKIIFLTLCMAVLGSLYAERQQSKQLKDHPQLLFVQTASHGEFDGKVLKLKGLSPTTLYFSDRPNRLTGHLVTKDFFKLWNTGSDSFKRINPNAVLSVLQDGKAINAVVVLSQPKYSDNCIAYRVQVLEGEILKSFMATSLFIDAYPVPDKNQNQNPSTQTNPKVLADSPAVAMGNLYQATAQALGNAAHNATSGQQQTGATAQAATTMGVAALYNLNAATLGKGKKKVLTESVYK